MSNFREFIRDLVGLSEVGGAEINNEYHHEYTLGLALFDLIPVALSVFALFTIAFWMQGRASLAKPAWVGAGMTAAGGVAKVVWKLIVVTTGVDLTILAQVLFPLLGGGFVLLAVSILLERWGREQAIWPVAGFLLLVGYGLSALFVFEGGGDRWTTVTLIMTVAGSSIFYLTLATIAAVRKQVAASALVLLSLGSAFYLAKLARLPDQTLEVQWTAEIVNASGQLAFLIGAILISRTALCARQSVSRAKGGQS